MQIKQDLVRWLKAFNPSEINQLNEKKPSLKKIPCSSLPETHVPAAKEMMV